MNISSPHVLVLKYKTCKLNRKCLDKASASTGFPNMISLATHLCIFCLVNLAVSLTGSVKDSVVGEERIAQYFLAVLNTRGTPFHWKHLNNRRVDGIANEAEENHRYDLKNLKQRRGQPNRSDLVYVEVTSSINGI